MADLFALETSNYLLIWLSSPKQFENVIYFHHKNESF